MREMQIKVAVSYQKLLERFQHSFQLSTIVFHGFQNPKILRVEIQQKFNTVFTPQKPGKNRGGMRMYQTHSTNPQPLLLIRLIYTIK